MPISKPRYKTWMGVNVKADILVLDHDLTKQMFAYSVSNVEIRGLSCAHYHNFTATSNKGFRHSQKPLLSDH